MTRLFFLLFCALTVFFAFPFGALTLCREQLLHTGTQLQTDKAVFLVTAALALGGLFSALSIAGVWAGFPAAWSGTWQEQSGVFQEWVEYRKPDPQQAAILVDGAPQWFGIRNIKRGELQSGDELRFWVKPAGDRDIYVTAWRHPPQEEWHHLTVSFGTQQERSAAFVQGLVVLAVILLAMLTRLFFRIRFWKEPPGYLAVTVAVAAAVLAATGRLVYRIYQGPTGEDQVILSTFQLLLWCSYGAMLWTLYAYGRAIFTYNQRYLEKGRAGNEPGI